MEIYVVKEGDNVDAIARSFDLPVEILVWDNQIEPPYRLAVGQALYIRGASPGNGASPSFERPSLYVFGYAYPFIDNTVLEQTLPSITDVYVFSYGFTMDGRLVPPAVSDQWLIEAAWKGGVRPIMTLTPLGADGRFNNALVTQLMENPQTQQRLIWSVGNELLEKGFAGVDIDFEYVERTDREGYARFVALMNQMLTPFGYQVTVALAPKTSAGQQGLLYEGMDYRLLGEAADRVMLMTYEWGYTSEPIGLM